MIWNIGIYLSGAVFLVTIVIILLTARKNNSIKIENKLTFLMGGIAVSAIFFFFPICYTIYQGGASGLFISIFETHVTLLINLQMELLLLRKAFFHVLHLHEELSKIILPFP